MRPVLILCLISLTGCGRGVDRYVDTLYADARSRLEHGDLPQAQAACRKGSFLAKYWGNEEWDWKFRWIEAEILVQQLAAPRAAALLAGKLPASLAETETGLLVALERGGAAIWTRNFLDAGNLLAEAEIISRLPGNGKWLGSIKLRQGTLAMQERDVATATERFLAAIHLARDTGQPFVEASALTSLGYLLMQNNRPGEAIDWLTRAVQLSRKYGMRTMLQRSLGNLGTSQMDVGETDAALVHLLEAEKVAGEINLLDNQCHWLKGISTLYAEQGDSRAALAYDERALAIARKLKNLALVAECLHNLATHKFDQNDFQTALALNREEMALKRAAGDRASEIYGEYLQGHLFRQQGQMDRAADQFAKVAAESRTDLRLRWQAQIALAKVDAARNQPGLAQKDYQEAVHTFDEARTRMSRDEFKMTFRSGLNRFYSGYIQFLADRGNSFEALRVAELSRAQVISERLGVAGHDAVELAQLQDTANKLNATLLSYWLAPKESYLWVVTARDFTMVKLPPAAEIERLAEAHSRAVAASRPESTQLFDAILAPAQRYIPKDGRAVIIPDGGLFRINFETLMVPDEHGTHYWIEDATVSTATSLALLPTRMKSAAQGNVLLIGDPVSPRPDYPSLLYSKAELHAIADRFQPGRQTLIEGAAATPSAYQKAAPGAFTWIHFAAHAVASKESPLDSAIILSNEGDSFRLYARDIAKLPLTADLVTVSACYGSGSRTFAGEGIVGLAWAFLLAGSHNVVASLWEANDYYTAQLMDRLYERLRSGDDAAHALRTAKRSLLHSGYTGRNPRYWGAFQLYTGY